MQDEELFVGGYIIRRIDEENFEIVNALDGAICSVTEARLTKILDDLWHSLLEE